MNLPVPPSRLRPPRQGSHWIVRDSLLDRLEQGRTHGSQLTVVSAPAGSGKTTLVGMWAQRSTAQVAWVSLDPQDNGPLPFLSSVVAALQTVLPGWGGQLFPLLQAPQPPPLPLLIGHLGQELAGLRTPILLVLDDFHVLTDSDVPRTLSLLLDHLPLQVHVVLMGREDPPLPLARLRAAGNLTEVRYRDLQFNLEETARFLQQSMGLELSAQDILGLEARTEGWIVGLQLAALSLQNHPDPSGFIRAFTGSHRHVLDYLMEEVLGQQTREVQRFLLCTAVLDRMCGPLCAALLDLPELEAQQTLQHLEHANLFLVPLDSERGWYRYHHLFQDLLRQHLGLHTAGPAEIRNLHLRAAEWLQEAGLGVEAFQHRVKAGDLDGAEGLVLGGHIPLHVRSHVDLVLDWMGGLPEAVLAERPLLALSWASFQLVRGHTRGVLEKIQLAEKQLQQHQHQPLLGQLAAMRSTLALTRYDFDSVMQWSGAALDWLDPQDLSYRAAAVWTRAAAHLEMGCRREAGILNQQALLLAETLQDPFSQVLALTGVGQLQLLDHQLHRAKDTFLQVLHKTGDPPLPSATDAVLGLARIHLEWNQLDLAESQARQSVLLAREYGPDVDRFVLSELWLVRILIARGDLTAAAVQLAHTEATVRVRFPHRLAAVLACKVDLLLGQNQLQQAQTLARHLRDLQSVVRVALAAGDGKTALAGLEGLLIEAEQAGWGFERLQRLCWKAAALELQKLPAQAVACLQEALLLGVPQGSLRTFMDTPGPLLQVLRRTKGISHLQGHIEHLLALMGDRPADPLDEPLSKRELQILQLVADGLSNQQIGEKLFLALDTVKGHNRNIFAKLQVGTRTAAVRRARELGLL